VDIADSVVDWDSEAVESEAVVRGVEADSAAVDSEAEVRGEEADSAAVGSEAGVGGVEGDSAAKVREEAVVEAADLVGEVREAADSAVGLEASSVLTSEWSYCPRSL